MLFKSVIDLRCRRLTVHVLDRCLRVFFILEFHESESSVGVRHVVLRNVHLGRKQALLEVIVRMSQRVAVVNVGLTDAPRSWFALPFLPTVSPLGRKNKNTPTAALPGSMTT